MRSLRSALRLTGATTLCRAAGWSSRSARCPGYYIGSVGNGVSPADRRRPAVRRFDTLHSPRYDENWGAISPSHAVLVTRLTTLIRPGGDVLSAGRPRPGGG
jgi:hypothetical protein